MHIVFIRNRSARPAVFAFYDGVRVALVVLESPDAAAEALADAAVLVDIHDGQNDFVDSCGVASLVVGRVDLFLKVSRRLGGTPRPNIST
jgi:hypothetical protein